MTTSDAPREAFVWIWLPEAEEPVVAGRVEPSGDVIEFNYGRSYLGREDAIPLYLPELPLRSGMIAPLDGLRIAGCIKDAGPDAWGQRVIMRHLLGEGAQDADPEALDTLTYLLRSGSDRIGALDFQESATAYVSRDESAATLSELLEAADRVDRRLPLTSALDSALLHGSSVGGTRPKALLIDGDRKLIAKFSSSTDTYTGPPARRTSTSSRSPSRTTHPRRAQMPPRRSPGKRGTPDLDAHLGAASAPPALRCDAMSRHRDTPQAGIFALGTASHAYLEFDLHDGADPRELIGRLADLREPRTTIGGVNLVVGVRPEVWADLGESPAGLDGFNEPVIGPDGFTMPATQHDAVLWLAGAAYDVVFDEARAAIAALAPVAAVADEVSSWPYRHDRDLTGFIDGTENPSLALAPDIALVPSDAPGAGGSVLLLQRWTHDVESWEGLARESQERTIGRTKDDSTELEDRPEDSHVARTDQEDFGDIFRRNTPYGTVTDHGTMFVGFAAEQGPLARMLASMAGIDGPRDALTRYTTPLTGSYYFVPSTPALVAFAGDPDAG